MIKVISLEPSFVVIGHHDTKITFNLTRITTYSGVSQVVFNWVQVIEGGCIKLTEVYISDCR